MGAISSVFWDPRSLAVGLVSSDILTKTCSLACAEDVIVVDLLGRGLNGRPKTLYLLHRHGASASVISPTSCRTSPRDSPKRSYFACLSSCLCAQCLAVSADSLPGDFYPTPVSSRAARPHPVCVRCFLHATAHLTLNSFHSPFPSAEKHSG